MSFKFTEETKELLNKKLSVFDKARLKRERVREYIEKYSLGNKKITKVDLARAAGYDMNDYTSKEYAAGASFIKYLIKSGYLERTLTNDVNGRLEQIWYFNSEPTKKREDKVVTKESADASNAMKNMTAEKEETEEKPIDRVSIIMHTTKCENTDNSVELRLSDITPTDLLKRIMNATEVLNG